MLKTARWGIVSLFIFAGTVGTALAVDHSIKPGDQVVAVDVQNAEQLKALLNLDLDIWSHEYGIGPMDVHASVDERKALQKAGLTWKVKNADLFAENLREQAELAVRSPGDFTAYKDFAGIEAYINNLATTRPDLCTVSTYGTSIQSRPLYVLKITGPNPGPKPAVFYHGLIHAREWITGPVSLYLAEYLVNNYDTNPCIQSLVNGMEFYIAPVVNPDGYVYTWTTTRLWRKNRRANAGGSFGVDLNRNFGYQWGFDNSGSSGTASSDTYRGTSGFSEPETAAIRDFLIAHPNIKAYMDYHSYSQLLMWPWGYTPSLTPDNAKFAAIGNYMNQQIMAVHGMTYTAGPTNTTIYPANGVSIDYAYGAAGKFAYTIELRDTGATGFQLPADQITPTCQENLPAILYLSRYASTGVLLDIVGTPPSVIAAGSPTAVQFTINNAQESYVGGSGLLYYRYNPGDPYSSVPLNLVSGQTYSGTIPAGLCGQTLQYYATASGSLGYLASAPCNAPTAVYSASVQNIQPPTTVFSYSLSANPGWTTQGQWAYGVPQGICGDPTSGFTGPNVYGYNLAGCYADNIATVQYLTTTPINCTGMNGVTLRFRRWHGQESSQWDHSNIQASNDGVNWTTIWSYNGPTFTETSWSLQTYSIASVADNMPSVRIRWGMGTSDTNTNSCGWNIDDVEIIASASLNCSGITLGDVNNDTKIDGADVAAFVRVLLNPTAATSQEQCAADITQNCGVTLDDVDPFVALLLVP
ncbi:MAG: hypothetical protein HZA51_05480 [Planctomycetes bacterium]|nr:hypothetical protein [Planctomycetota bacterium]